ncbi:MAG: hypothetical protein GXO82_06505 [Chlorobi bacterium]|nr:hypothetical protein [Chlorobiota bacterium]
MQLEIYFLRRRRGAGRRKPQEDESQQGMSQERYAQGDTKARYGGTISFHLPLWYEAHA